MEVTINGERVECALTAHTLMLYEIEFDGADLIADVSSNVTVGDLNKATQPDGEVDKLADDYVLIDFTKTPWTKVLQAVWAMIKTVDDSVAHYDGWSRGVTQVDSWELRRLVNDAVNDTFFHQAAPVGEGEE